MSQVIVGLAFLVGLALVAALVIKELRRQRRERLLSQTLATFAPAIARVHTEPRELVAWASIARTARTLHPDLFRELDAASGGSFPFPAELIEGAHARWTSQWLAWERAHDLEYKRQATLLESQLLDASANVAADLKAQLAAVEQEKLQRYQERYEEYVRVGKAIEKLP